MLKIKSKSGTATTEIAIGTTLAVAAIIIAIGLFNENLAGMVTSGNLSNFFTGNNSKTEYSAMNRDYSDSQINVQIMGEQGLQMLRRKANNKAINQIGDAFSGVDTSVTNANSIGYLALAIKSIVGNSDICVYMKKDSNKFCNEDKIGGYTYKVNSSSSALTINKVDEAGNSLGETRVLTIGNGLNSITNSAVVNVTNGRSTLAIDDQYNFIKDLSTQSEPYVYSHVILIKVADTFTSARIYSPQNLVNSLKNALTDVEAAAQYTNNKCGCFKLFSANICPFCSGPVINDDDLSEVRSWKNSVSLALDSAISNGQKPSASDIAGIFSNNLTSHVIDMLNDDRMSEGHTFIVNPHKVSCYVLRDALTEIAVTYNIPMENLNLANIGGTNKLVKDGAQCTIYDD